MKPWMTALIMALPLTSWGADYDWNDKTRLATLRLRIPEAAMAIKPLQANLTAKFQADAKRIKEEAAQEKKDSPENFRTPYALDTQWRVTFENAHVLSLSGLSFYDEHGAHPNEVFDTLIWDKTTGRQVALLDLFPKDQGSAALRDLSRYAKAAFMKWAKSQDSSATADLVQGHLEATAEELDHCVLTYARGDTKANGLLWLSGAGQDWPHVLGDIRISIPTSVFRKYLAPQWVAEFK